MRPYVGSLRANVRAVDPFPLAMPHTWYDSSGWRTRSAGSPERGVT